MTRLFAPCVFALFVLTSTAFATMDSKRIVTAVDAAAGSFSCYAKEGEPSWTYKTTDKTVIRTSGQRTCVSHIWHRGNFSDIKVGRIVTVRYHLNGSERIAERVIVYPAQ